jgi:ATP-binding cassette, subfamily B, multidrug efflux pump
MLRLAKYLKPFILLIILAIGLLFVQAMADLALPDYMSDIINVGIQQNGIESAVPQAIRKSEMDKLTIFMAADNKNQVLSQYTLIDSSSADYQDYLKKYPVLSSESVYVLNSSDQTVIDALNPIIGKSILAVSAVNQLMADPSKLSALGTSM